MLREHIPLELGQVFHGPDIISPSRSLLSSDWLSVENLGYRTSHFLVLKLDPALREMGLFRRCKLSSQIGAFGI